MTAQSRHDALEYEIFREQAGALGVAGKQLQSALDGYHKHLRNGGLPHDLETVKLLDEVASKAYALLLQREFVGFAQDNIEWLEKSYQLPDGVLSRLGSITGPGSRT